MLDNHNKIVSEGLTISGGGATGDTTKNNEFIIINDYSGGGDINQATAFYIYGGQFGGDRPNNSNDTNVLFGAKQFQGSLSIWVSNIDLSVNQTIVNLTHNIDTFLSGLRINIENQRVVIERKNLNETPTHKLTCTNIVSDIKHILISKKFFGNEFSASDTLISEMDIYVNGIQQEYTSTGAAWNSNFNGLYIQSFTIGDPTPTSNHSFIVQNLSLWNIALSSQRVKKIYNNGNGCKLKSLSFYTACIYDLSFNKSSFVKGCFIPIKGDDRAYLTGNFDSEMNSRNFELNFTRRIGPKFESKLNKETYSTLVKDYIFENGTTHMVKKNLTGVLSNKDGGTALPASYDKTLSILDNKLSGISTITYSKLRRFYMNNQTAVGTNELHWSGQQNDMDEFHATNAKLTNFTINTTAAVSINKLYIFKNTISTAYSTLINTTTIKPIDFRFYENSISGNFTFPDNCMMFYGSSNQLTGAIPTPPNSLKYILIDSNPITGLPANLNNVEVLYASSTQITGTIYGAKLRDIRFTNVTTAAATTLTLDLSIIDTNSGHFDLRNNPNITSFTLVFPTTSGRTINALYMVDIPNMTPLTNFPNWALMSGSSTFICNGCNQNVVIPLGTTFRCRFIDLRSNTFSEANLNATIDSMLDNQLNFDGSSLYKELFIGSTGALSNVGRATRFDEIVSDVHAYNWSISLISATTKYGFNKIMNVALHATTDEIIVELNAAPLDVSAGFKIIGTVTITGTSSYNGDWIIQSFGTDTAATNGQRGQYFRIKKAGFVNTGLPTETGTIYVIYS